MTDVELLAAVKSGLGITGTYQDVTLNLYIADVKYYLISAGVKSEIVNSDKSVGAIIRGVADLWHYGTGEGKFSEYFYQRVIQLTCEEVIKDENV